MTNEMKDWKLEDECYDEIETIIGDTITDTERLFKEKDIKEFLRRCEKQKICSIHHRYDCGCEDRYMMVSLSNIKELAGKSLMENKE